jgi:hypothetical protein
MRSSSAPLDVVGLLGHGQQDGVEPLDVVQGALQADDAALVEEPLVVRELVAPEAEPHLVDQAAVAVGEQLPVVGDDVAVAGVGDATAVDEALGLRVEDLPRDAGVDLVLVRAPVPEAVDGADVRLDLLGDLEGVAGAQGELVQLVDHPVDGVLGEDRGGEVARGLVAEHEGVGLDVDGHLPEGGREGEGLAPHEGLVLVLPEHPRVDHGPLAAQRRHAVLHPDSQALDAFEAEPVGVEVQLQQR